MTAKNDGERYISKLNLYFLKSIAILYIRNKKKKSKSVVKSWQIAIDKLTDNKMLSITAET